jgi:hypothetical protein
MILPRGAFHSIKRGVLLPELMHDLEIMRFSGQCMGSAREIKWTVVYRNGACILTEFGDLQGTKAWLKMISQDTLEIDAALSAFTDEQIRLALEFNKPAVVQRSRETATRRIGGKDDLPGPEMSTPGIITALEKKTGRTDSGKISPDEVRNPHGTLKVDYLETESSEPAEVSDKEELDPEGLASKDLDSLNVKDIEKMTRRIRMNLKDTVEKLSLGYLMEEKEQ